MEKKISGPMQFLIRRIGIRRSGRTPES